MAARRANHHARRPGSAPAGPGGRRPVPIRPARRRTAGSVLGAFGALVALLGLLGAVPAVLLYGTLAVIGMGDPVEAGLSTVLTSPDDGRLFLWALVAVGWVAWLCFAGSVLLEIPAQLRGRVARRIPALGWSQRIAAGLVGSVLALLPVAGSAFAAAPAHVQAVAPAQLAAAPQYPQLTAAAPAAAPAADPQPGYTVRDSRPADSLWSIAERQLGSGERWQEIARLNDGRVMDSSGTRFDADRPIQPGWQLLMPADAKADQAAGGAQTGGAQTGGAPAGAPAPTAPHAGGSVTVAAGDTLSAIAQRELGSAEAWPQLFEANKGAAAPDGERLTDPDVVVPGMVLAIPGAPAPASPAPAPDPAPEQPAPAPAPSDPAPASPAPESPAPASSAPASSQPSSAQPSAEAAGVPVADQHHARPSDDYSVALAASGISVLLAAVLIGSVSRRRVDQQRARRPRHRIALPAAPAAAFEAELKARQSSPALDLLNRALRTLSRNTVRGDKRLPALVAARVTPGRTVELHLAAPAVPIAPFRAAHAPNVWWCPEDSSELLSVNQAAKAASPYPALVTLGSAPDGSVVLADLETVRLVHLAGHPDDAGDVLRTLAIELAHSPLADRLHLHLVGFGAELPIAGPTVERVHHHETIEAALAVLGPRTAKARATLIAADATSPRDARSRGHADDSWVPEIVLSAQPPSGDVPTALGRLLDGRPRTCLAVLTRAPERGAGPVARWTLPSTGQITLPGLHLSVELQRLSPEELGLLGELVRSSGDTTQHPAPDWTLDGPGSDLEPAELPLPVPVLAGVGAAGGPLGDPFGSPLGGPIGGTAGPRPVARVVGTGVSPFAGIAPTTPGVPPVIPLVPAASGVPLTKQPPTKQPPTKQSPTRQPGPKQPGRPGPQQPGSEPSPGGPAVPPPGRHSINGLGLHAAGAPAPVALPAPVPAPEPVAEPVADPYAEPPAGSGPEPARGAFPEPVAVHEAAPAPIPAALPPAAGPVPAPVPAPGAAERPGAARSDSDDLLAILRSPEAHTLRTAPRIRLLGPVDVLGAAGTADQGAVPHLTELAAFLALRPGTDHTELDRGLHPGAAHLDQHPTPAGAPANPLPGKLTALASWLGASAEGREFLPAEQPEGYRLAPTVSCDWDEFRSLYRRGMRSTSSTADAALAHALALVRGAPFAEATAGAYGWAEAERQDMLAAIVDTAHELAARRLQYGDHRTAEAAIFRALAVAPEVELLHRDLFYAYASAGARDQLVRAVNRLDALSRRTGRQLDPDTVALLRDLLSGS
ncbi:LysM peptidoglycan-binding domain-containing protein [Kitasatospora sp. NPDC094015]|uniref:LysM peptidoglycan-binding domain-containing protein n=1 Tax=Kitasatospora sp. NPDC094015 TaxID=3155205 RepID=UPI00332201CC